VQDLYRFPKKPLFCKSSTTSHIWTSVLSQKIMIKLFLTTAETLLLMCSQLDT